MVGMSASSEHNLPTSTYPGDYEQNAKSGFLMLTQKAESSL